MRPPGREVERHLLRHGIAREHVVFSGGHRWGAGRPMFGAFIRYALG